MLFDPDHLVCRFYAAGECKDECFCPLPHAKDSFRVPDKVCRFHLKNKCIFGNACFYEHVREVRVNGKKMLQAQVKYARYKWISKLNGTSSLPWMSRARNMETSNKIRNTRWYRGFSYQYQNTSNLNVLVGPNPQEQSMDGRTENTSHSSFEELTSVYRSVSSIPVTQNELKFEEESNPVPQEIIENNTAAHTACSLSSHVSTIPVYGIGIQPSESPIPVTQNGYKFHEESSLIPQKIIGNDTAAYKPCSLSSREPGIPVSGIGIQPSESHISVTQNEFKFQEESSPIPQEITKNNAAAFKPCSLLGHSFPIPVRGISDEPSESSVSVTQNELKFQKESTPIPQEITENNNASYKLNNLSARLYPIVVPGIGIQSSEYSIPVTQNDFNFQEESSPIQQEVSEKNTTAYKPCSLSGRVFPIPAPGVHPYENKNVCNVIGAMPVIPWHQRVFSGIRPVIPQDIMNTNICHRTPFYYPF